MAKKSSITAARLRERMTYDPDTGEMTWLPRPATSPWLRTWNARFAGKPVGAMSDALGYLLVSLDGVRFYAHQAAHLWMTGEWPTHQIDHKDMNRANNAWRNLRPATKAQNMHNTQRCKTNTSGHKNVSWHKQRQKWHVQIRANGLRYSGGLHSDLADAVLAAEKLAAEVHGEFARS